MTNEESTSPDGEALGRALEFLSRKPRARGEVSDRLRSWGYSQKTSSDVTNHLESRGYLDDREFARLYLEELVRKGFGSRRVRQKLAEKRLDRELIEETMEGYPIEHEADRAFEAAVAKVGGDEPRINPDGLRRLKGYLIRRGFPRGPTEEACRRLVEVDTQNWREYN